MDENKTAPEGDASTAHSKPSSPLGDRPPRILLAEDDMEMRKMLTWSLEKAGYEVVECQNGNSLMKHLMLLDATAEPQEFDLIVSDIRMPGYTGLQVLESAMEFGDYPPVILITAFPDEEVMKRARQLKARAVFEKPFQVDDLIDRIRHIVPKPLSKRRPEPAPAEAATVPLTFPLEAVYRHDSASEPIKAFVHDMAAKLNPFGEHIIHCSVVIDEIDSDHHRKHRYHVKIQVVTPGSTVVVRHDSDEGLGHENLYFAIRIAFATVSRKLKHRLGKRRTGKNHSQGRGG